MGKLFDRELLQIEPNPNIGLVMVWNWFFFNIFYHKISHFWWLNIYILLDLDVILLFFKYKSIQGIIVRKKIKKLLSKLGQTVWFDFDFKRIYCQINATFVTLIVNYHKLNQIPTLGWLWFGIDSFSTSLITTLWLNITKCLIFDLIIKFLLGLNVILLF